MSTFLSENWPVLAAVLFGLQIVFRMGTIFVERRLPRLSRTHMKREIKLSRARISK